MISSHLEDFNHLVPTHCFLPKRREIWSQSTKWWSWKRLFFLKTTVLSKIFYQFILSLKCTSHKLIYVGDVSYVFITNVWSSCLYYWFLTVILLIDIAPNNKHLQSKNWWEVIWSNRELLYLSWLDSDTKLFVICDVTRSHLRQVQAWRGCGNPYKSKSIFKSKTDLFSCA